MADPEGTLHGDVDWGDLERRPYRLSRSMRWFLASLVAYAALFYYDYSGAAGTYVVGNWAPIRLDWLYLLAVLLFGCFVVLPAVENRGSTVRYWRRFRRHRPAVVAAAFLGVLALVGTFGPLFVGRPGIDLYHQNLPPLGFTVERGPVAYKCLSGNVGTPANPLCAGTWHHPLGTNADGKGMIPLLVTGARVTMLLSLVAAMLIVPLATLVGVVAGYRGGIVDDLLMSYVDVQETVPAFVVYVILIFLVGRSLFLIVVVFGLLSWGGPARVVRGEVVKRKTSTYVRAARSQGASHLAVVRRHILPNVSATVVVATTRQIPVLLLTEAAIAYLGLSDAILYSWGAQIAEGGTSTVTWWIWLFPALALAATIVSVSVVGDALRDTFDPRDA
ncbi:ABC transporter permease [Halorarius halobius]|uniref:ABC transporter permease n=1 Tax=Halorarius halobius TaxID=2962671 RepID=UPI0020CFD55B|nr:ABC transporter permease [Halorarius halobius]